MMKVIVNLDQEFFDRPENSSGALTARMSAFPAALQELVSANFIRLIVVVVNVISSSILSIAYGWKLGLVLAGGAMPLLIASGYYRIRLEYKLEKDSEARFAEIAGLATEVITSMRTVASLTLEQQMLEEYSQKLQMIVTKSIRSLSITLIPYALSQNLEFCVQALAFWYGSKLVISNEYTALQFFIIFIAVIFGGQSAGEFFGYTTSMTKAKNAANYILWLRTIRPTIRETMKNREIGPSKSNSISVEGVQFQYPTQRSARVLKGIDLKVCLRSSLGLSPPTSY
jgi:ATP-binding cassette subfamily B (MDR/TAP) protein 1